MATRARGTKKSFFARKSASRSSYLYTGRALLCSSGNNAASKQSANLCRVAQGPRVGDKTLIDAITAEYAKADPVYVAKTMVS